MSKFFFLKPQKLVLFTISGLFAMKFNMYSESYLSEIKTDSQFFYFTNSKISNINIILFIFLLISV